MRLWSALERRSAHVWFVGVALGVCLALVCISITMIGCGDVLLGIACVDPDGVWGVGVCERKLGRQRD